MTTEEIRWKCLGRLAKDLNRIQKFDERLSQSLARAFSGSFFEVFRGEYKGRVDEDALSAAYGSMCEIVRRAINRKCGLTV